MSKKPEWPSSGGHPPTARMPITEADLHAYVDGQLSAERHAQVQAHLAANPDQAAKAAGYRRIDEDLHALFDPVLQEDIPDRLRDMVAAAPKARPPGLGSRLRDRLARVFGAGGLGGLLAPAWPAGGWQPSAYAATLLWLGLGLSMGLGWQLQGAAPQNTLPPMVKHAAVAYATYASEVVHPVEVRADDEAHLEAWLSRRLGIDLKAAKLDAVGFSLMGGRLLAGTQRPVAQFMYEDKIGRRLTLYVKTQESGYDQSVAFRFAREDEVNAFYWIENGTGYVLSGNLGRADLLRVAEAVYAQLIAPGQVGHGADRPVPLRQPGQAT